MYLNMQKKVMGKFPPLSLFFSKLLSWIVLKDYLITLSRKDWHACQCPRQRHSDDCCNMKLFFARASYCFKTTISTKRLLLELRNLKSLAKTTNPSCSWLTITEISVHSSGNICGKNFTGTLNPIHMPRQRLSQFRKWIYLTCQINKNLICKKYFLFLYSNHLSNIKMGSNF